ncbi:hypothetical protein [Streptomyces fulvoviolaceus]|uniref:hypothetical protein n=1 Tax=Streptomyces fulvoviolaceus TaxID=285535 RepID=UPI0021C1A8E3|nr:hypothetical protein [Streptomyces fulvoviolaceus]MCT9078926.1 hypothetical protein [Streptomyces fulvoviolaceus]
MKTLKSAPPKDDTHWSMRSMRSMRSMARVMGMGMGMSQTTVSRIWRTDIFEGEVADTA